MRTTARYFIVRWLEISDDLEGTRNLFSPNGSNIHVNLEQSGGMAKVSVKDEGPGIPDAEQSKLFQGFHWVLEKRAPDWLPVASTNTL